MARRKRTTDDTDGDCEAREKEKTRADPSALSVSSVSSVVPDCRGRGWHGGRGPQMTRMVIVRRERRKRRAQIHLPYLCHLCHPWFLIVGDADGTEEEDHR